MMSGQWNQARLAGAAVILCVLLLSLFTVGFQVSKLGLAFIEQGSQMRRHQALMQGTAKDPWQYRLLSEHAVDLWMRLLAALGVPHAVGLAFISFRLLQNLAIFLLAGAYYRRLGLSSTAVLFGLSFLAWAMSHALFDSDLSLNTYSDLAFYLLAAWLVLAPASRPGWIVPLTFVAALNRETSGLIPLMPLTLCFSGSGGAGAGRKKLLGLAAGALLLYAEVFIGLRVIIGPRPLFLPYGHKPGLDLFLYNVLPYRTWLQLLATMGLLPALALLAMRRWPAQLRALFWLVVPLWFGIHFFASVVAETRLLLVPQALVFIPGALFLLPGQRRDDGQAEPAPAQGRQ